MRILMINTVPMERNGITNVICNIIENIDHGDIIIDCVAINSPDSRYKNLLEIYGGEIYVIPNRLSKPHIYVKKLAELIRQNKYDAVHAHGNSHTLALEMMAAKMAGCPFRIAHSHNTTCKYKFVDKIMTPLFELLCTDRIACGIEAGKWLFGKKEFWVLNNGIDIEKFRFNHEARESIRRNYHSDDDTLLIGHVGEFNDFKNQEFLVSIFAEIIKKRKACLLLVGIGPRQEIIRNKVNELEINKNVIFVGVVDNVNDYLSAIDIIVMPSLHEGLPLTLVEEQASGLVCYVSDCITSEVNITGNVYFIPINIGEKEWADAIIGKCDECDRDYVSDKAIGLICKEGYSIKNEVAKLQCYYLGRNK